VMRAIMWRWMFARWCEKWRLHYLEKYGAPFLDAEIPKGADKRVRDEWQTLMDNMIAEHSIVHEVGSTVTVTTAGAAANSDEGFERYETWALNSITRAFLGTSDMTSAGDVGSNAAVNTRVGATADPRMVSDALMLASTESKTLCRRIIYENAHKFDAPIGTVPIPYVMPKTADDEVKVDAGDKANENREAARAGERPYEVQGPANDNAAVVPTSDVPATAASATPAEPSAPVGDVQKQALNGAQVTSLVDVIAKVAAGELPRESALELITIAFPVTRVQADAVLGTVGNGFVPTPPPAPEFNAPAATEMSAVPKARPPRRGTKATTSPLVMALRGESVTPTRSQRARPPKP